MAGEVVSIIVTKHLKMRLFFPPFPRVMCLHSFSSLFVAQVFVKYGHRDTTTGPSSFSLFWHKEDLTRAHKDGRMKKKNIYKYIVKRLRSYSDATAELEAIYKQLYVVRVSRNCVVIEFVSVLLLLPVEWFPFDMFI